MKKIVWGIRRKLVSCNEIEKVATKYQKLQPNPESCNQIEIVATNSLKVATKYCSVRNLTMKIRLNTENT
ncbi:hypothetical protein [Paenisporosarcina sp. TG20]|uniref:hypothetical protein n=1 Tax=Paenisporosarcina sp. TG20 TaxID=1211706 RepID=UPI0012F66A71|nr:hypothetical protein [Paenisporosarcina sp. TG20]